MTFSLLSLDKNTGTFAGATATGNLCVGGWVLRGQTHVGMTASQGAGTKRSLGGRDARPDAKGTISTRCR